MKLSGIDLNLLVVLDAIISERSVTAAGRRVGLSQPAASAALRRLRTLLGDPILERAGARWRLTSFALELREPLQEILASIDATINRRSVFDPTSSRRRFSIAAADDVACVLVQPLLARLEKVAPHMSLLVVRPDAETGDRLTTRQIDLSIEPDGRYRNRGFLAQRVYRDPWVVAVWTGNTKVGRHMSRDLFMELGHVTVSVRPYAFTLLDRVVGSLAQKLDVQVVSESFTGLAMLLRGTSRIALMPGRLALRLKDTAEIRLLAPPMPLTDVHFAMSWPSLHSRDDGHAWLRTVIGEVAAEIEAIESLDEAI